MSDTTVKVHVQESSSPNDDVELTSVEKARTDSNVAEVLVDVNEKSQAKAEKSPGQLALHYFKNVFSICAVGFSLVTVLLGVLDGESQFYDVIPSGVQFLILIVDLLILGVMEGIQISIVELKIPDAAAFKLTYPRAYAIHKLLEGDGVDRFLIGRQITVVFSVFILALLTSFTEMTEYPFTNSQLPAWFIAVFLKSGMLGALVVVCIAQLTPQIVSSRSPVEFLNLPGMIFFVWVTLILEGSGICNATWLMVKGWEKGLGWQVLDVTQTHADANLDELYQPFFKDMDGIGFESDIQNNVELYGDKDAKENKEFAEEEGFSNGVTASGKTYKAPAEFARELQEKNIDVPQFLLPKTHAKHIPPHIVVINLLDKLKKLERQLTKNNAK